MEVVLGIDWYREMVHLTRFGNKDFSDLVIITMDLTQRYQKVTRSNVKYH